VANTQEPISLASLADISHSSAWTVKGPDISEYVKKHDVGDRVWTSDRVKRAGFFEPETTLETAWSGVRSLFPPDARVCHSRRWRIDSETGGVGYSCALGSRREAHPSKTVSNSNDGCSRRLQPVMTHQQPNDFHVHFISQNVHGLNEDKEAVLLALMSERGVFQSCLQETWQVRESLIDETAGSVIVRTNVIPPAGRKGRVSCGLAIVLSAPARRAWSDASSYVARYGPRVMAVRLKMCWR
jgi:hypothetical protein